MIRFAMLMLVRSLVWLLAFAGVTMGWRIAVAAERPAAVPSDGARPALRRFALLIGANDGGPGRDRLRYAVTDARSMARVLGQLGGIAPEDLVVVADPTRAGLEQALAKFEALVRTGEARSGRREVIVYYSGHSDEHGLLLGGDSFGYGELRTRLQGVPGEVRVAILDSCSSGAFTRRKGGQRRPPFLVDSSNDTRGHAFLTSSAPDEAAQESDRIAASFFTHYLVSGLRGAADVNRDRRVTLQEAYQFAAAETLARTERTRGGPQHAGYEFELAGTGELVVTDVRSTASTLVLGAELSGRLSVREASGALVAELRKTPGHAVELGLEPGTYVIGMEAGNARFEARTALASGARTELGQLAFSARGPGEATALRGGTAGPGFPEAPAARTLPVHAALVGEGSEGTEVNGLAVGLVAEHVTRMRGLELALGLARTDLQLRGVQMAVGATLARGDSKGLQLASGVTYAEGTFRGAQLAALVAVTRGDAGGLQVAGLAGWASGSFTGAQVAGGYNHGADLAGVQLAPVNAAGKLRGTQLGVINVARDADGLQLGVVNVGRRVGGFQLGVINVVDQHDGEALGLITLARNGVHDLSVTTTDALASNLTLKLGSRHLYTALGASFHPGEARPDGVAGVTDQRFTRDQRWFGFGAGLGWRFGVQRGRLEHLDLELYGTTVQSRFSSDGDAPVLSSLRLVAGIRLAPGLRLVAGAGVNTSVGWQGGDADVGSGVLEATIRSGDATVRIYPGLVVGLAI